MLLPTHLSKLLWVQNSFPNSCKWGNRQVLDSCVAVDRPEIRSLASCLHLAIWLSYVQIAYTIKCMWLLLLVLLSCHKCSDPQQKRLMAFLSWCHWPSRAVKQSTGELDLQCSLACWKYIFLWMAAKKVLGYKIHIQLKLLSSLSFEWEVLVFWWTAAEFNHI